MDYERLQKKKAAYQEAKRTYGEAFAAMERNQPLLDLLQSLAQEKGATPAQISLAWMLHKKDFIVPIPGMRKTWRMEENFGASDVTLTGQEYEQLEKSLADIPLYGNRTDKDIAKLRTMR